MTKRQALLFGSILVVSIGCDHATKEMARSALAASPGFSLVGDAVRFELVANPGAFLSLGARLPDGARDVAFLVLAPLGLLIVCALLLGSGRVSHWQIVALGFVAGGGLANWIDRLLHSGAVTDFVSVGIGPLRTGIFNLADVAILLGVALLLFRHRIPRNVGENAA
jgi:signal peptidase II